MSADITHIGEIKKDGMLYTPEQTLQSAIDDIGKFGALEKGKKLIIVCVDETEDCYRVTWYQCGMKMSQCLALCEVAKSKFLEEMDY